MNSLRTVTCITRFAVCVLGFTCALHGVAVGGQADPSKPTTDTLSLIELVTSFFQTHDAERRSILARQIEKRASGDAEAVADALGQIVLWPSAIPLRGVFSFESTGFGRVAVGYRLPDGYDPVTKRYPVILCYPSTFRPSPEAAIGKFAEMFGDAASNHIFLSPSKPLGGTFHLRMPEAAGDVPGLFHEARKRFRTDSDRVVLTGVGRGADAAWIVALMHSDIFSAVLCVGGIPEVPYPKQTLALLVENLGGLEVVALWEAPDGERKESRIARVAQANRFITRSAKRQSISVRGIEQSLASGQDLRPDLETAERVLNHRRLGAQASRSFRFRYPLQGVNGWVRQVAPRGDAWLHDQLSILPSSGNDYDTYVSNVIERHMGFLARRFEANTFTVQCRGCKRVEVNIPMELVDWSRPITIVCNGKRRFDVTIAPDIRTMLTEAYDTWQFQHPIGARRSISLKHVSRGQ